MIRPLLFPARIISRDRRRFVTFHKHAGESPGAIYTITGFNAESPDQSLFNGKIGLFKAPTPGRIIRRDYKNDNGCTAYLFLIYQ